MPYVWVLARGPDDAECEHHRDRRGRSAADPSGQVTGLAAFDKAANTARSEGSGSACASQTKLSDTMIPEDWRRWDDTSPPL
jgi:hypothetical protein